MKFTMITVFSFSLFFASPGFAQHTRQGRGMHPRGRHHKGLGELLNMGKEHRSGVFFLMRHLDVAKKRLKLTDKQIQQFQKIGIAFKKQFLDVKKKLIPEKLELQKQLLSEKIDLKKVKRQLDKIAGHLVDIQMLKIKHRLAMENVLTKSQRLELRTIVSQRKRPGHRFGPGMHPGD
ncbi:hypothetical protein KKF84_16690 [Myxococcota bacterium]|nr:hypothetical protein [Myxococcota bacterium]MBU1536963.1 hypothetical protein [Myxococcota bacterium]